MDTLTYMKQLDALVAKMNEEEAERNRDKDSEYMRHSERAYFWTIDERSFIDRVMRISSGICERDAFGSPFKTFESQIAGFLQIGTEFKTKLFYPYEYPDTSKPLEENVRITGCISPVGVSESVQGWLCDIYDFIIEAAVLLGKKAYQSKSLSYSRLVNVIARLKVDEEWLLPMPKKEAEFIAKELSECEQIIEIESLLIPNEEKAIDVVRPNPTSPYTHFPDYLVEANCEAYNKANQENRSRAIMRFRYDNFDLLHSCCLGDFPASSNTTIYNLSIIFDDYILLIERGILPSSYDFSNKNIKILSRILTADLKIYYEEYSDGRAKTKCELTEQWKERERLIKLVERFIWLCMKRAHEIQSCSYRDWSQLYGIFMPRNGLFLKYGITEITFEHKKAAEFVSLMQAAMERLWADDDIYKKEKGMKDVQSVSLDNVAPDAKEAIGGAIDGTEMAADIKKLSTPPKLAREDVIDLVGRVYIAGKNGKIEGVTSVPKAIQYIRDVPPPKCIFHDEAKAANDFAVSYVANKSKKKKGNIDGFWRSIRTDYYKSKKKKKNPHAPVPILNEN